MTWHSVTVLWSLYSILFQTIQKVCPICSKRVLKTVIVRYDPCRCIRRMCRDCDAELEKSGTDSCEIHFFSCRDTRSRRKKTCTTWPFYSFATVNVHCTELLFDVCLCMYVYYTIFTRMWMWNITTLVSEATSKPRACFTYHTVLRAATRPSQSTFCCSRWPWVVKWQWYGIEMNLCLCSVVCRWFWEKLVHGM